MFKLSYDWEKELAPVSLIGLAPQVILVHPSVPATNMKELIALVKANPGKYSYGSAGLGTPGYLAGEMLKQSLRHRPPARAVPGRRPGRGLDRRRPHADRDHHHLVGLGAIAAGRDPPARRHQRQALAGACRTCRRSPSRASPIRNPT